MLRFFINILLVICFAMPLWGKFAGLAYVDRVEWEKKRTIKDETTFMLYCDTTATDTVWTLELQGFVMDGYKLLIKTGDDKVLELEPFDCKYDHVRDSIGHNPITGELIEYYHYESVLYYHITGTALNYISEHGIKKLRCGNDIRYKDKNYNRNEFGKNLTEAYRQILYKMSPDYVREKKPTIRDGF